MTNKERVTRALKRKPRSASAIAKSLKLPASSVRRIFTELREAGSRYAPKRTKKATARQVAIPQASVDVVTTDQIKARVALYLAETAHTDPISALTIRDDMLENMRSGPHRIDDVLAMLDSVHGAPRPTEWFRPVDLARGVNAKPSTVRDTLVRLREEGRAEHDPERDAGSGRWRYLSRPQGYTEEDIRKLVPKEREEQDKLGLRIYDDPQTGQTWLVAYDPEKHYSGPAGKQSHHRKVADVRGGRSLGQSRSGNHLVAVLHTPLHRLTVVDVDRHARTEDFGEELLGYAPTPRGLHAYFPPGIEPKSQDGRYHNISFMRDGWNERLFDTDGTPRPMPRPTAPHWNWSDEMDVHRDAWLEAQRMAVELGIHREVRA